MDNITLETKVEQPIRALAKELEGRGQMTGIVQEIIAAVLANIRKQKLENFELKICGGEVL